MHQHVNRFSAMLVRSGLVATVVAIGLAFTPRQAEAAIVCTGDARGCAYTKMKCKDIDLPKGWTCTAKLAANPQVGDIISREKDGRAVILANRQSVYILSDALDAQFSRKKPSADEFVRLVLADRGAVSELSLQQLSKELAIPIARQAASKP